MSHKLTIETIDNVSRVICEDEKCNRPILEIKNGELSIESKHGSAKHRNVLTTEDLRLIAVVLYQQLHPPERW